MENEHERRSLMFDLIVRQKKCINRIKVRQKKCGNIFEIRQKKCII